MSETITAMASPNIALVKYWGKRGDGSLNLPNNSSVSFTLSENILNTKTSVAVAPDLKEDAIYINGELQPKDQKNEKTTFISKIIEEMRKNAGFSDNLLVVSNNSFPTGSGLASSASGASALVFALNEFLGLKLDSKELSIIARRISGSACRSMAGGFVYWKKGELDDGSDSYAEQIAPQSHWDVVDMIGIVNESRKKVSSSQGHSATTKTSVLYKSRPEYAEKNADLVVDAVRNRNFAALAEVVMRDSNNMHATMLDTWPPIRYLNDMSWDIIEAVHDLNGKNGESIAAYTFDAGPNAHVITTAQHANEVREMLSEVMGEGSRILEAPVGSGPKLLSEKDSLITGEFLKNI
ncbi:MAG: diphosphomevalonate decarboxylase [Candidatus Marsarchaeota archaeon]|nr:diphosphomevalonate decarboxylase [Candidatus Marsarchaeota archaeon]